MSAGHGGPSPRQAFAACRAVCRRHARSFYFASFFLPREKREAAYAIYAFCRLLDDAADADAPTGDRQRAIARFAELLDNVYAGGDASFPRDPIVPAFASVVRERQVPKRLFVDLINGCRMDLTVVRYANWPELELYCYHVAGVVGLIMCRVFGLRDDAAEQNAVAMGNAMQMTNILRDVKEDFSRGRIYLPQDELARFGCTEADLATNVINDAFRSLMQFQIARARDLYRQGFAGLAALPADGSRFTASVMGTVYAGILDQIERQRYDVFKRRARLPLARKIACLPAARRAANVR